ncbi:hypothetical protein BHMPCIPO_06357 [Ensifer sesbaniae]|nr:hypothetical protein [Ensifer sesbaniae]
MTRTAVTSADNRAATTRTCPRAIRMRGRIAKAARPASCATSDPNLISPAEIARLLLMRWVPRRLPEVRTVAFTVLGAIIPISMVASRRNGGTCDTDKSNPVILPLHPRPALLAGVAIVERAGHEMLQTLRGQMIGQNQARFSSAMDEIMNQSCRSVASSQLQLIGPFLTLCGGDFGRVAACVP